MADQAAALQAELAQRRADENPLDELERLRAEEAARTADFIDVDTSPVPVPPPRERNIQGGPMLGEIPLKPDAFSPNEREDAARGVDIHNDLQNPDLRKALGFSPGDVFSLDFLQRKLGEQHGIPPEQAVRQNLRGQFEWLNPATGRYTPVDKAGLTFNDLREIYGESGVVAGAVVGGIGAGAYIGALTGGVGAPTAVSVGGGFGAFIGEYGRLDHGRNLGVHDLTDDEMFALAVDVGKLDLAFGAGGQLLVKTKQLVQSIYKPKPFSPEEAQRILDGTGNHKELVDEINLTLEEAGSARRFKLDPVADAEDALGLEQREAAAKLTNKSKAARAEELKANEEALEEYGRLVLGIEDTTSNILTDVGAAKAAVDAKVATNIEAISIRATARADLRRAEQDALDALADYTRIPGQRSIDGAQARSILRDHAEVLKTEKTNFWDGYKAAIGHSARVIKSKVKVPVSAEASFAHGRLLRQREASLIKRSAAGGRVLKPMKKGDQVDLAVLDADIKELRALERRAPEGIAGNRIRDDVRLLVDMRNNYLRQNDPATLALLESAEEATRVHTNFVNEGVFAGILKQNSNKTWVMDNVAVFKQIFQAEGGEPMRQLLQVARKNPGAMAEIERNFLKMYRANVIPPGQTLPDKTLHDNFVRNNDEVLAELFPNDPNMLRFGRVAKNLEQSIADEEAVARTVADSALGKIAGANPETMGKIVFRETIDEAGLRTTMTRLRHAGPQYEASMRDAAGREIYRRITAGGVDPRRIANFAGQHGAKLDIVMGPGFSKRLTQLAKALELNSATAGGKQLPVDTFIGRLARTLITPPLTQRGRAQTLVEKWRQEAGSRILHDLVRDPKLLQEVIDAKGKDIKSAAVLSILSQTGGMALAIDD